MIEKKKGPLVSSCVVLVLVALWPGSADARPYKLRQSTATGRWFWECKDGSASGWENTKKQAKAAGKEECGRHVVVDGPYPLGPMYEPALRPMEVYCGCVGGTPSGEVVLLPADVVSEAACRASVNHEVDDSLDDDEALRAFLLVWGIYTGGYSVDELSDEHDISEDDAVQLESRDYYRLTVDVGAEGYEWDFDYDDLTGCHAAGAPADGSWVFFVLMGGVLVRRSRRE